jgi:hypothetical protein
MNRFCDKRMHKIGFNEEITMKIEIFGEITIKIEFKCETVIDIEFIDKIAINPALFNSFSLEHYASFIRI